MQSAHLSRLFLILPLCLGLAACDTVGEVTPSDGATVSENTVSPKGHPLFKVTPSPAVTGESVTFQLAAPSSPEEYTPIWYVDGEALSSTGSTVSHTFEAPGEYTVSVENVSVDADSEQTVVVVDDD